MNNQTVSALILKQTTTRSCASEFPRLRHFRALGLLLCLLSSAGWVSAQTCACLDLSAISWWKAENNASDSVSANHGTLLNGATFAAGQVGQAFTLDGIDDYVSVPDAPNLRPINLTIEGWFKFAATDSVRAVVSKPVGDSYRNSYQLALENDSLKVSIGNTDDFSPFLAFPVVAGQWYHIAFTFNDATDTIELYVDGVLVDMAATTVSIDYDNHPVLIGVDDEGVFQGLKWFYAGEIDEVTLYNTALTGPQIVALYNSGILGKDKTPPTISALPAPSSIECPATPSFATPTAADACDASPTLTFADVTTPGSCPQEYSVTRTWTATDACGNTSTASQTINVVDAPPLISALPGPSTVFCPATPVFATPTASDACTGSPTLTFVDVTTPGLCPQKYSVTRTWTATDACGQSSMASQTITVDDAPPIISALPGPTTIFCPAAPVFTVPTASDDCGSAPLTFADVLAPGTCPQEYSVTRTWTATDSCGQITTASQTITVEDNTAPVISALPAPSIIACPSTPSFVTPTATDDCGGTVTLTSADVTTPGTCLQEYSVTRTWTATDPCGNTSTASQTITVEDNIAPAISALPAPSVIECPATPAFATPTATDDCGGIVTLTSADVTTPGTCLQEYSITRTWTATDPCGNTSTASQTITVEDNTAPVISALPAPSVIECPATPAFATPTATDDCGGMVTLTSVDVTTPGTCLQEYSITRTWTATDPCGNTSTASQTITVEDTTAPVISALPAPSVIECPATPAFATPTATDDCGGVVTLTSVDTAAPGTCANEYSITRTWTATDACGNTSTASQTITVEDNTAPVISALPAPSTAECPAAAAFATPTATDACGGTVTLTFTDASIPGTCPQAATVTRTWTASDACGNTSMASQTITLQDTTAPSLTCPMDIIVNCGNPTDTSATGLPTVSDACDAAPTVTHTDVVTAGSCPNTSVITRTWKAKDGCGNEVTCDQTITVVDVTAPVLTCPTDIMVATDSGQCFATLNPGAATATDGCDASPTVSGVRSDSQPLNATYPLGFTTITWTAFDCTGNTISCTQSILVQDTVAPTVTCPADIVVDNALGQCSAPVSYPIATATDLCPGAGAVSCSPSSGLSFPVGTTMVTCTSTDGSGNVGSCQFSITVVDAEMPTIVCPPDITAVATSSAGVAVTYPNPAISDNCSASVLCLPSSGTVFPIGTTSVLCMAMDLAGNSASCGFQVVVTGTTPRSNKIQVRNELVVLLASITNSSDRTQLTDAINHLNKSLAAARWLDDFHPANNNQGEGIFNEEKKVVDQLRRLRISNNSGITAAVLQGFINRLVAVDRELLTIAINDAIARNGRANRINSATNERTRGDTSAAADNPEQAIDRYKQGWKDATSA